MKFRFAPTEEPDDMAPPVTQQSISAGDLQTVVAALQALTVQLGAVIQQLNSSSSAINTSIADLVTATAALDATTKYAHLGAAGSLLVNTGLTKLYGVVFNNFDPSGATFATLTIYDGASTAGAVVGAISYDGQPISYGTGLELATGLYVVAAGTPVDVTIAWSAG